MKKLTITIADDDLMKVVGTLLKVNADFSVETVSVEPLPDNVRTLQRKTDDGRSAAQVFLDVIAERGKVTRSVMCNAFEEVGFGRNTVYGTAGKLRDQGLITFQGDYYVGASGEFYPPSTSKAKT